MFEPNDEFRDYLEKTIDGFTPGFIVAAKKLRHFYDILAAEGLPEVVIMAEITAWCQGESRVITEPMIHHICMQQREAHAQTEGQHTHD